MELTMATNSNFAVFILSHGRPDNVLTYEFLNQYGYTGKIYIIIDNEDSKSERYYKNFGDQVLMFDKAEIAKTFDEGDNFGDRRTVVYARNACFEIAEKVGVKYFMELDDDYNGFQYRIDSEYKYALGRGHSAYPNNLDLIFNFLLDYYKSIPAKSIAIAQGGDFIGGKENKIHKSINLRRKCMNTFICSTGRPFKFVGRINEDVNTYTWFQGLGNLFMTFPLISIRQRETQLNSGGMTELYLDTGTYIKSFYTVMYAPSSVKIRTMGETVRRLHHSINWDNTVPKIISEKHMKQSSKPAPHQKRIRRTKKTGNKTKK